MATMVGPLKGLYSMAGYTYFNSITDSVEPSARLIADAETELQVLAGELSPLLWNDPRIRAALTAVTSKPNPPTIEIVFGPADRADADALSFLKSLAGDGKVTLHETDQRQQGHFMVADRLNVKIEDPHKPNVEARTGYAGCGLARLAQRLRSRFQLTKQIATPVVA